MKEREYKVVKSNTLIQKGRYELSLSEYKIMNYIISMITPYSKKGEEYVIDTSTYCKIAGISDEGGNSHGLIKKSLKTLSDKSFWLENEKTTTLCRWIEKPTIIKNTNKIIVRLDKDIEEYLINLRNKFTEYELLNTLALTSKYSIRLYDYLRSLLSDNRTIYKEISLQELNDILQHEFEYGKLKQRVLEPGLKEILSLTDINFNYEPIKTGRSVTHIRFTIKKKIAGEDARKEFVERMLDKNNN